MIKFMKKFKRFHLFECYLNFQTVEIITDNLHSVSDNVNLYRSLISITEFNCFENFDTQKLLEALSEFKAFNDDDICTLNIEKVID